MIQKCIKRNVYHTVRLLTATTQMKDSCTTSNRNIHDSAMKTVKQCVQATAFPQTSDPNPSESPTYDSLMHDHIHTSCMHHIHYYYLWVGSALRNVNASIMERVLCKLWKDQRRERPRCHRASLAPAYKITLGFIRGMLGSHFRC